MPSRKVVILGAGLMGEVHYRAWKALEAEGVEVVAVAKSDGRPRAWLQREQESRGGQVPRIVAGYREAIALPGVDIVDVCLPTPLHRDAIEAAAAAGKAVVCEKPLARSAAEAEAAVEAAARRGVPFMVAQVVRFFPDYRLAREAVVCGQLGVARSARCFRVAPYPPGTRGCETSRKAVGSSWTCSFTTSTTCAGSSGRWHGCRP
ncbi:MAG: Gfo/Idh/MocA family oxidoreductase [Limnochordaceae bacterium]|nr:Gfo/Idh/MocA family oxidoreductase [Limnochordaceae bacterium]